MGDIPCKRCKGLKKIARSSGRLRDCPACFGKGLKKS